MVFSEQFPMNIERKMEFIVENLAVLTANQQKTDRQMRGLQTLVKTGMRMQALVDQRMAELAAAQKRTDEKFQRWLNT
jgi:hypothetical protein